MKTIIKNTKQTIVSVIGISCVLFSVNSYSLDYVEDAKQYLEKGETSAAIIQLKNQLKLNDEDIKARFLLGKTYLDIGEVLLAEKELSIAARLDPENSKINLIYAELLLLKGDYKKLRGILVKPYSSVSEESLRLAYLGYAALGEKKLDEARLKFNQSLQKEKNSLAYNGLAKMAFFNKNYDLLNNLFQKSLQVDKNNIETLRLKARLYNINQENEKALEIYNRLIKLNNKNVQLYAGRIATYMALKQYGKAGDDINVALKISPDNLLITYLFAQLNFQKKDFLTAQKAAQKILNIRDTHFPSMLILGVSHFYLQNYNQADKYLTQYLSVKPNDIQVQNLLANVYLSQRKPEQALLILEGLDKDKVSSSPEILLTMGSAYLLTGDLDKGVQILNKAQMLSPENVEIKKKLIAGNLQAADWKEAITNLEKLAGSSSATKQYKYLLIVTYIQQKELETAEKKLDRMIQQDANDPGLYNLRAVIEKLNGNVQKAIENYNKALSIDVEHIPAYAGLAQLALESENFEEAQVYYEKIISLKKDYIRAYTALASIAGKQNNLKKVEEILLKAYHNTNDVVAKVRMATLLSKLYAKQNRPESVMPLAKELISQYPDNFSVMSFMAGAQIAIGKIYKAQSILKKIIANNPSDVNHRMLLANLLSTQDGTSQEVLELLNESINIKPEDSQALMLKTAYLLKLKKLDEARQGSEQLIAQFPEQVVGYKLKGEIFLKEKQYTQALDAFHKAYQIQPDNKLLFVIVDLMRVNKKSAEGLALLKSELAKNRKNIGVHFKLASIYQQQKQFEKAILHYKKMLNLQSDNVLALNNLAGIYLQQNNPLALRLAKQAYEKEPESAAVIDTYGYIQVKMGDLDEGIKLLKKAASLSPVSYDASYHLAVGYARKGDRKKAKILLKPLLGKSIKFAEKEEAQALFEKL